MGSGLLKSSTPYPTLARLSASIGAFLTVFVRFNFFEPSASLTSSVAYSHDSAGNEMLKLIRSISPCGDLSTTMMLSVSERMYERNSATSRSAMNNDAAMDSVPPSRLDSTRSCLFAGRAVVSTQ